MKQDVGIPSEHFERIIGIFKKYSRIDEAVLFGSRAKGCFCEGSDIDFSLKGDGLDFRLLTQIEMDYDALNLPWKLDLLLDAQIENEALKSHIRRVGIVTKLKQKS